MRLVVTTDTDQLYNLEIDSSMAVEDLKALLESEVGQYGKSEKLGHVQYEPHAKYTRQSQESHPNNKSLYTMVECLMKPRNYSRSMVLLKTISF